ncbi:MAG: nucleotidyltransferase domain-containing protein [Candidatus Omnitrophica bacterium]|nr:nucleotidyltransferase domain-containing protein [Candidatus Omnitrophota bacterium]
MKKKKTGSIFNATNSQKVLDFLASNPGKEYLSSEIQKATFISRAGAYFALKELSKEGLVSKQKKGKFLLYSIIYNDSAIKQFKVLQNVLILRPLVSKLKPSSKKIVLYGSASRGENDPSSDIDLFILSKEPDETKKIISSVKTKKKMQTVIKTPAELADFKKDEKVYYSEVERGVTLWEETE